MWPTAYLVKAVYTRGVANPCLFHSKKASVCVMVHGDDFLAVGDKATTDELNKVLTDVYKVECEVLGDGDSEVSDISFNLNSQAHGIGTIDRGGPAAC